MLTINIPDSLTNRIHDIAKLLCQTAEEFIIDTLQDRIDHDSACRETEYLAESGKYEVHYLH